MAAKQQRAGQRERHAARVESIRDSGRAAADDLRTLSRPGTAVDVAPAGSIHPATLSLGISPAIELAGVRTHPSSTASPSQAENTVAATAGAAGAAAAAAAISAAVVAGDAGVDKHGSRGRASHAGARASGGSPSASPSASPGRTRVAMVSKESAVSMMAGSTTAGRAGSAASSASAVRYEDTAKISARARGRVEGQITRVVVEMRTLYY